MKQLIIYNNFPPARLEKNNRSTHTKRLFSAPVIDAMNEFKWCCAPLRQECLGLQHTAIPPPSAMFLQRHADGCTMMQTGRRAVL